MKLQENFLGGVSKLNKFFQGFKNQKNFSAWPEVVWQNFLAGTEALNKLIVGDELYEKTKQGPTEFTEGGIRIQENSPKSGGREET